MIAKKYKVVYSSSILYDVPSLKEEEGKIEIDQKNYTEQNTITDQRSCQLVGYNCNTGFYCQLC